MSFTDLYKIDRQKLGSGAFGSIHSASNNKDKNRVAVKLERRDAKCPQLEQEYHILRKLSGGVGIPKAHFFGTDILSSVSYNIMVLDLLGPSLEDLFNYCNRKFPPCTVYRIAIQLLHRFEFIHNGNVLHRDIKPENFLMGYENRTSNVIYVIDFGLSKFYRQDSKVQRELVHIPFRQNKALTGTARYASIPTHMGFEQGRRDDLEALGYLFIYFLTGKLPWQGLQAQSKNEKYDKIMQSKVESSLLTEKFGVFVNFSNLSESSGLPTEQWRRVMADYLKYCWTLKFNEKPDYKWLRRLFYEGLKMEQMNASQLSWDWYTEYIPPSVIEDDDSDGVVDANSSNQARLESPDIRILNTDQEEKPLAGPAFEKKERNYNYNNNFNKYANNSDKEHKPNRKSNRQSTGKINHTQQFQTNPNQQRYRKPSGSYNNANPPNNNYSGTNHFHGNNYTNYTSTPKNNYTKTPNPHNTSSPTNKNTYANTTNNSHSRNTYPNNNTHPNTNSSTYPNNSTHPNTTSTYPNSNTYPNTTSTYPNNNTYSNTTSTYANNNTYPNNTNTTNANKAHSGNSSHTSDKNWKGSGGVGRGTKSTRQYVEKKPSSPDNNT